MMIFFQVRPKAALFGLLKQIGATHEVLTRKEVSATMIMSQYSEHKLLDILSSLKE
jgi:hypothetical protein